MGGRPGTKIYKSTDGGEATFEGKTPSGKMERWD